MIEPYANARELMITLECADMREALARMEPQSVDAIVTDPPYGLSKEPNIVEVLTHWIGDTEYTHKSAGFMGKEWDSFVPGPDYWRACERVLKPGGYLIAFGGTRTYDLMTIALRIAGFEIRDTLSWLYGSGFPKSLNISKAIDKAAGAEREVISREQSPYKVDNTASRSVAIHGSINGDFSKQRDGDGYRFTEITAPATDDAIKWNGWGTALKPAWEPIIVARKRFSGTVASNVLEHGTGALNIDACRIGFSSSSDKSTVQGATWSATPNDVLGQFHANPVKLNGRDSTPDNGRWPPNVAMDEEAARLLDEMSGERKAPKPYTKHQAGFRTDYVGGAAKSPELQSVEYGDKGGASRFMYVAKASASERNAGLDDFDKRTPHPDEPNGRAWDIPGSKSTPRANSHPTVKPIALMKWLIEMVLPPGGLVVDPFAGSFTTGCAAAQLGVNFHGIEREENFVEIGRARIEHWEKLEQKEREQIRQSSFV